MDGGFNLSRVLSVLVLFSITSGISASDPPTFVVRGPTILAFFSSGSFPP
jgi:hypothetical protein